LTLVFAFKPENLAARRQTQMENFRLSRQG
jgi:hypothetical protein